MDKEEMKKAYDEAGEGKRYKKYVAVLLILAVLVGAYYAISSGMINISGKPAVRSAGEAANIASDIGKSLQNSSSTISDIEKDLGI